MKSIATLPVHLQAIASSIVIVLGMTITGELGVEQVDTLTFGIGWALWAFGGLVAWAARAYHARKAEQAETVWKAYHNAATPAGVDTLDEGQR